MERRACAKRCRRGDRRLHRERGRLINERGQHINRIKRLCAVHGVYDYEPTHPKRMLLVERLRTPSGDQLLPRLKEEIKRELRPLELVVQMIKAIEIERDAVASAKAQTHTNAVKIQKLVKLKGIGAEFVTVLVGEVFFRPFTNRQRVALLRRIDPEQSGSIIWKLACC